MEKKLTAFIVEDNGVNRIFLETTLEDNNYTIIGSKSNAEESWELLKNMQVDIVLIDINLAGDKDGIWLANKIRKQLNLAFVYLTAYGDSKTIEKVKKTKPNGYLMKPYNEPTLLTTLSIAIENFKKEAPNKGNTLFIKDNYIRIRLNTSDILFIKSEGNYLEIILENKKHLIRAKLTDFIKELHENNFIQVHRRYIINTSKINIIGNGFLTIRETEIPVSKTFNKELMAFLKLN